MGSPSQSVPLPVGLIGLGKHGARYLAHIQRDVPGLRVVATSRRDLEAGRIQAKELGVRFHSDPGDLVADPEVRAVISVVPPTLNPSVVEACAAFGRPLLIEKPFATDASTAFRMRDRLHAAAVPCLVAQTLRYSAVVGAVRDWSSELGRVSQILLSQSFEPTKLDWLDDPARAGGGNVLHTGVHMFDLLRFLSCGEVDHVSCFMERVVTTGTEDSFSAAVRLDGVDGPILGAAAGSRATQSRSGQIRVVAERGQIVADHVHGTVALLEGRDTTRSARPDDVPTVLRVLEEFVRVVDHGVAPSITATDGAAAVAIADACYRSAESGARVRVRRGED